MIVIKKRDTSRLDRAIDELYDDLAGFTGDAEEYGLIVYQLGKLHELRDTKKSQPLSMDTLAIVSANILGIIIIVGHERMHVITSKALNFTLKMR